MKYIIGNWKAYKDFQETQDWIKRFLSKLEKNTELQNKLEKKQVKIVICPPYQHISLIKEKIDKYKNITVGSQDISTYDEGKFTGEVPAKTLSELVEYAIIGHSERRSILSETEEQIETKIAKARAHAIEPILCIRGKDDIVYDQTKVIAFEPVESIGTGSNMLVDKVEETKKAISLPKDNIFLYGGSVTRDNYQEYLSSKEIDGLLIGSASLDPEHFLDIADYGEI